MSTSGGFSREVKRSMRLIAKWVLLCLTFTSAVRADQRFIVRALGGQLQLNSSCLLLGCNVLRGLDDPLNQLFLLTIPDSIVPNAVVNALSSVFGVVDIEPDVVAKMQQSGPPVPAALYDTQPVTYFGSKVREGYVAQPAAQIVRIQETQTAFHVAGTGIVAAIDTGVDPNQPVLVNVLLPGYDFTRNHDGTASEISDILEPVTTAIDGLAPVFVNGNTAADVNQSTAAVVDNPRYAAFGHGTMVAGVIHLVAPRALILPLKAFRSDGTGYTSDILRAIYRAVRSGARVINMSFSMPNPSTELRIAVDYATLFGSICVASAGNDGQNVLVYPAALSNVIGVASTTNDDQRSTFSNYGQKLVWVAAPGEGIITTYPYDAYAAVWGTSFSAPLVSGAVALMLDRRGDMNSWSAAAAIAQAKPLGADMGHGRIDLFLALQAAQTTH